MSGSLPCCGFLIAMSTTGNWKFVKHLYFSRVADNVRFAIREWPATKRVYLNVISFLVTVALLVYLGPFGTWAFLPVSERLPFWASTVGANWIVGYVAFSVTSRKFRARGWSVWAGLVLAAAVAALPGTGMVWLAVTAYMDYRPSSVADVAGLFGQVFVLHLIIGSLVFRLIDRARRRQGGHEEESARPGRKCGRRAARRAGSSDSRPAARALESGRLLHLRMQDHYVEVHTAAGSELLLLRFRDALREVEGVNGLQVHRSPLGGPQRRGRGRAARRRPHCLAPGERQPCSGQPLVRAIAQVPGVDLIAGLRSQRRIASTPTALPSRHARRAATPADPVIGARRTPVRRRIARTA